MSARSPELSTGIGDQAALPSLLACPHVRALRRPKHVGKSSDHACPPHAFQVAYLRSYWNMGRVEVACVSGCTCRREAVDAFHDDRKVSVTAMANIQVAGVGRGPPAVPVCCNTPARCRAQYQCTGLH